MGIGLPYAIAAYEAYHGPNAQASSMSRVGKKVVAIEGNSAFGFAAMEIESIARFQIDIFIFVTINGGSYLATPTPQRLATASRKNCGG
jgi:2-hydroxyacyl-CoA lyase 1